MAVHPTGRRNRAVAVVLLTLGALGGLIWTAQRIAEPASRHEVRASLSAVEPLTGDDTIGYARALEPRVFEFPKDHGPHPDFRTEWWYVTGNLEAADGREFGIQLTFFRNSVAPSPPERSSAWNTNQLWMAHAAITDVANDRHVYGERFARGAVGLAGAEPAPFRVWLGDWEMRGPEGGTPLQEHPFPLELEAAGEDWALHLTLGEGKPPVFHGEEGLSRKGPEPGNASYYYSFTRLPAHGRLEVEGEPVAVSGLGWIDREWSTSALGTAHTGWDWFSLQLSDQREIMYFELRRRGDGTPDPLNHGSLVEPDGTRRPLSSSQVELESLGTWESPLDGTRYPSGWRLGIPELGIELQVTPQVRDQEMNLAFRYWEGTVSVEGRGVGGAPVAGRGYVELTGYDEESFAPPSTPGVPASPRE